MFVSQRPTNCEQTKRRSARRSDHIKPPSSYIAMIASAILSSPEKKMTLAEINDYLMTNYECFRGEYQGWKNSVRHNLSFNKCFVKINRNPLRPWAKDNYWKLDLDLLEEYMMENGEFRRRRKRRPNGGKSHLALNTSKHTNTSEKIEGTKTQDHRPLFSSFATPDESANLESSYACTSNAQQNQLCLTKTNPCKYCNCTICSIPASPDNRSLFTYGCVTPLGFTTSYNAHILHKAKTVSASHRDLSSRALANNFFHFNTFNSNVLSVHRGYKIIGSDSVI